MPSPRSVRRLPTLAALSLVAVVAAATLAGCDLMTATTTPRPSRLVATAPPTAAPTPVEIDEAPTLRPEPAGTGPGLVDAANALADLDSYRVALSSRGLVPATTEGGTVTMTSTLVQGDAPAAQFSMAGVDGFSGGRLQAIVIGDEAWLKEGSGGWAKSPGGAADFDAAFTTLSPIDLVATFDGLSGALQLVGTETRNGRRAIHYRTDSGDDGALEAGLTKGSADAWIAASGGFLVSLAIDGTWDVDGTPTRVVLKIDVTRVDDGANRISPP